MTEAKVEAGDRALETARRQFEEWVTKMEPAYPDENLERLTGGRGGYRVHNVAMWWMAWKAYAALIQSAMNAQERELREALRELFTVCKNQTRPIITAAQQERIEQLIQKVEVL